MNALCAFTVTVVVAGVDVHPSCRRLKCRIAFSALAKLVGHTAGGAGVVQVEQPAVAVHGPPSALRLGHEFDFLSSGVAKRSATPIGTR